MSWTCSLQVSDDCAGDGIFDAPESTPDGADCCLACARDRDFADSTPAGRWAGADSVKSVGELDDSGSRGGDGS